ncbi:MAG: phenylalanine--tRNA ligase beta subunit-related protein [Candidatus Caldarchaeales archaeon]
MVDVEIDKDLVEVFPEIYLSTREVETVVRPSIGLEDQVSKIRAGIHYSLESLKDNPIIRAFRDFYWRIGIDPTKIRPASEALVRRILSGSSLPAINNVVDAGNLASAETLIPIGLYDLDKIVGRLVLRFARIGEEFTDITGKVKKLEGNTIVLSDDLGIVHIFPHRDSLRTMIGWDTRRVLIIGCGVKNIPRELVDKAVDRVIDYLKIL